MTDEPTLITTRIELTAEPELCGVLQTPWAASRISLDVLLAELEEDVVIGWASGLLLNLWTVDPEDLADVVDDVLGWSEGHLAQALPHLPEDRAVSVLLLTEIFVEPAHRGDDLGRTIFGSVAQWLAMTSGEDARIVYQVSPPEDETGEKRAWLENHWGSLGGRRVPGTDDCWVVQAGGVSVLLPQPRRHVEP